jgi:dTDP-4-dehydrorhamnose 3,5-epimerase
MMIEPRVFGDDRGHFFEMFRTDAFEAAGLPDRFVQDNASFSRRGVLRGLHFQNPHGQGKLVYVMAGEVFDVAVDLRVGSPSFGKWTSEMLSGENKRQLYIPPGFAHGFVVTSESAVFCYRCTELYHPESERFIRWDDPTIGIDWPVSDPILAPRDAAAPFLADFDRAHLPHV